MSDDRFRRRGPGGPGGPNGPNGPGGRRKFIARRKVCGYCTDKIRTADYKDVSDRGKIMPRRRTGTCARHQRGLTTAIKRARHMALLPFAAAHTRG